MKYRHQVNRVYELRDRPVHVEVAPLLQGARVEFFYPGEKQSQVHLGFLLDNETVEVLWRGLSSILQPKGGNHSG